MNSGVYRDLCRPARALNIRAGYLRAEKTYLYLSYFDSAAKHDDDVPELVQQSGKQWDKQCESTVEYREKRDQQQRIRADTHSRQPACHGQSSGSVSGGVTIGGSSS